MDDKTRKRFTHFLVKEVDKSFNLIEYLLEQSTKGGIVERTHCFKRIMKEKIKLTHSRELLNDIRYEYLLLYAKETDLEKKKEYDDHIKHITEIVCDA